MLLVIIHTVIAVFAFWESWNAAQQLRVNVLKVLVFGSIGLIHGFVPAVGPVWYERTSDPYPIHVEAAFFALAGTIALSVGWRLFTKFSSSRVDMPTFDFFKHPTIQPKLERFMVLCALGGLFAWFAGIYATAHASGVSVFTILAAGRLEFRTEGSGIIGMLAGNLMCMAYVPGFLAPFLKGRYRLGGFAYGICFALGLFILSKGTRAGAIGICGSMIGGMMLAQRVSIRRLVITTSALTVIGALAIGMYPLRHRMSSMSYGEMATFMLSAEAYQDGLTQDPLCYHNHFVAIVDIFPEHYDYVHAAAYRRILFFYLPGSQFRALKPIDPNRTVAQALFGSAADEVDWMHPPGVFGDAYINFYGWYSLAWMVFEGMMLAWLNRKLFVNPWCMLAVGPQVIYMCMIGIRGQPYTIMIGMLFSLVVTYCLMRSCNLPRTIRIVKPAVHQPPPARLPVPA